MKVLSLLPTHQVVVKMKWVNAHKGFGVAPGVRQLWLMSSLSSPQLFNGDHGPLWDGWKICTCVHTRKLTYTIYFEFLSQKKVNSFFFKKSSQTKQIGLDTCIFVFKQFFLKYVFSECGRQLVEAFVAMTGNWQHKMCSMDQWEEILLQPQSHLP